MHNSTHSNDIVEQQLIPGKEIYCTLLVLNVIDFIVELLHVRVDELVYKFQIKYGR